MQNSFYAFAIPRFAALAAEVCKPTRTCHTGGNGNESNREEGKRANDRARLIRECSYSMASAPWPAFSFTSSIFSSAWGGEGNALVLLANSWVTSKVVVSDGRMRAARWCQPNLRQRSFFAQVSTVNSSLNYLFNIHCDINRFNILRDKNLVINAHSFA